MGCFSAVVLVALSIYEMDCVSEKFWSLPASPWASSISSAVIGSWRPAILVLTQAATHAVQLVRSFVGLTGFALPPGPPAAPTPCSGRVMDSGSIGSIGVI